MFDKNKHRLYMFQILKDIYSDVKLAECLGFKGGSALMFFYDLPRFSVDLDFNLLDNAQQTIVHNKLKVILQKYGKVVDEAEKYFGLILVLDYGAGERKLKVEISARQYDNHYEIKNLFGVAVKVLAEPDMFAHKLCALLDRKEVTNRDIFDCYFFMQKHVPVNQMIVEKRMKMKLADYIQKCIDKLNKMSDKGLLNGLGELTDEETKKFVRTKMRAETISLLKFYKDYPILAS
jgi:predicted nucleotidyltransferase component of viral defense system